VPNWRIGLIGTIYFVGYIVGSTYFPRLADIYGRKPFVVVGALLQSICGLLLLYSNNLNLIYANMFMIGVASPFLASIGYNYVIELIPNSMENAVNTFIMCSDACGSLIGILYFTYFSKSVDLFLLIVSCIGIFAALMHLITPESPLFLKTDNISQQSSSEVFNSGEDNKQGTIGNSASQRSENIAKETSVFDFVRNPILRTNIIVMIAIWSTTSAGYYLINFYMKYIGGTTMNNVFASVSSEIVASLLASIIFEYLGAKSSLLLFFMISAVAGGISCFGVINPTLITLLIMICKFGVSAAYCLIYITTTRIFPSVYSATAFGICNVFARVVTALIPMIIELPAPMPMIFFSAS